MKLPHTLLLRLIGPMQSWGYRSRFEVRDTGLEPTRSGVLGLLASACGIKRDDITTLQHWDKQLRLGVRVDLPNVQRPVLERSGFRIETDYHTAQNVMRATGKGLADTVLSTRYYLTDSRFTIGIESSNVALLEKFDQSIKNPVWTLCLGRKSFPLSLPPWLPGGGLCRDTTLLDALKTSPFPLLSWKEHLPKKVRFVIEPSSQGDDELPEGITMRLNDRPFSYSSRQFGIPAVKTFTLDSNECGMEAQQCFYQR